MCVCLYLASPLLNLCTNSNRTLTLHESFKTMANEEQPAWSSVDDESLNLILSLLSADLDVVQSSAKGKQIEGTLSDADLALQLFAEELNCATVYASDRRMTKSVQDAVQKDTNILLESELQENVARRDREVAVAQSAGRRPQGQAEVPTNTRPSETELEAWEKLTSKYIDGIHETENNDSYDSYDYWTASSETDGQPESSAWAASRGQNCPQLGSCIACGENKSLTDLARAPCEHDYCHECLEHLFCRSILDDSLFPPRCCRLDIPIDTSQLFLSDEMIDKFTQKSIELATPNRTYCHQATCSTFIPPPMIKNGVAQCPKCENKTCETCKGATHGGDCPSDTVMEVCPGVRLDHQ
ncbi:hypothetical protein F5B22DRAFT_630394 [Xylaria bambusicola]|uniref:uncharacterized protein n=1 Tax=Xylaria bambusicola TaxID=326684 RepID=UPI002008D849|nr:uncharacterized protein F5B22DRAFT_630394 [Xylaria bambusicola]KAI0503165.1 hypothetical protein F5B22DRAFT_630394 [Xylaria bambusicola]